MHEIQGKDVLVVLNKLKTPAAIDEIVKMIPNTQQSKLELTETVKSVLEAGIEFGIVKKVDENKYQAESLENLQLQHQQQPHQEENKNLDTVPETTKNVRSVTNNAMEIDSKHKKSSSTVAARRKKSVTAKLGKKKQNTHFRRRSSYKYSSTEDDDDEDEMDGLDYPEDCSKRRRSRSRRRGCRSRSRRRRRSRKCFTC